MGQPAFDSREFLRSMFSKMDANGDGTVNRQELAESFERMLDCSDMKSKKSFRTLLEEAGLNTEFFLFEQLDNNQDGRITWEEFEESLKPAAGQEPSATEPNIKEPVVTKPDSPYLNDDSVKEAATGEDMKSESVTCVCGGWW